MFVRLTLVLISLSLVSLIYLTHSSAAISNFTSTTNSPPVANNDTYSRHRGGYIGNFKSNDSDPDGDSLTYSLTSPPSHGTLSYDYGYVDDHPWYSPAVGFSGSDSLTYQICYPSNACASANVTINVQNQVPVA